MKNEFMNEIAKIAQEKFEIAKQLILEEMQDTMNDVEGCESDCECRNIIDAFRDEYEECACCQKCAGEVNLDSDYREISVLVDGENVAVEYDDDLEDGDVIMKLVKAIVTVIGAGVDERQKDAGLISRKEIEHIIIDAFESALAEMSMTVIMNAMKEIDKND